MYSWGNSRHGRLGLGDEGRCFCWKMLKLLLSSTGTNMHKHHIRNVVDKSSTNAVICSVFNVFFFQIYVRK